MTQRELADLLHLSDRTVSKWECGVGCPDVSLPFKVSEIFGVRIEGILLGDVQQRRTDGANMRHHRFNLHKSSTDELLRADARAAAKPCG